MNGILETAEQFVRIAGSRVRDEIPYPPVPTPKERGDLVTEADLFVEDYLFSSLSKLFPDYGFWSEEKIRERTEAEYVWVLDPIDGTKHYAKGLPLYSISLALKRRGEPILGVVYSWELGRMYCAAEGQGATMNGRTIHCSSGIPLEEALICMEIPHRHYPPEERQRGIEKMALLIDHCQRVRIIGIGSLGLCFCAEGGLDAYVNIAGLWKECDIAAGQAILKEAGGEFYLANRKIVAGPEAICDRIRDIIGV